MINNLKSKEKYIQNRILCQKQLSKESIHIIPKSYYTPKNPASKNYNTYPTQ